MKKILLLSTLLAVATCAFCAEESKKVQETDPYVLMELFGDIFSVVKSDYVEDVDNRKLIETAVDGMLTSLDPHSGFMDNESFNELQDQTKGEFAGLGLEVSTDKGFIRVVSPIDDTPAFKAGLKTGDYITHIDGMSVTGMSLNEAIKKMRGEPKTTIVLTIVRDGEKSFDVQLERAIIKVNPVRFEAKGDVGYVRIISFSEETGKLTQEAIKTLKKQIGTNKIKGFVIDLRNNPGGLLDQAVAVADIFLTQGEIVSTRSRNPDDNTRYSATAGDLTDGAPVVVLINEGSASASEIVSGALQDHGRAVIVGLKSFGKGSVQTVRAIPGFGGIRLTTARYYTPSGHSIQAKGIIPDIEIPRAKLQTMPTITDFGENVLPKAIGDEEGKKAQDMPKNNKTISDNKGPQDNERQDYQLDRAIDIVRGMFFQNQWNHENKR